MLSDSRSAQYGAPPSVPLQKVCAAAHVLAQTPSEQTCCAPHATPHAPQLASSVFLFAQ
jgi:hypothetical protein